MYNIDELYNKILNSKENMGLIDCITITQILFDQIIKNHQMYKNFRKIIGEENFELFLTNLIIVVHIMLYCNCDASKTEKRYKECSMLLNEMCKNFEYNEGANEA